MFAAARAMLNFKSRWRERTHGDRVYLDRRLSPQRLLVEGTVAHAFHRVVGPSGRRPPARVSHLVRARKVMRTLVVHPANNATAARMGREIAQAFAERGQEVRAGSAWAKGGRPPVAQFDAVIVVV
jgi:hypothetical protein